jgi:hypothetical protein
MIEDLPDGKIVRSSSDDRSSDSLGSYTIYVPRVADVAVLDEFIGPKP